MVRGKNIVCLLVLLGTLFGRATSAQATIIASDSFSYTTPGQVNNSGSAGGGWNGAWSSTSNVANTDGTIVAPTMSYTGYGNSGNQALIAGASGSNALDDRTLSSAIGAASGQSTVYISWLMSRNDSNHGTGGNSAVYRFTALSLGSTSVNVAPDITSTGFFNDGKTTLDIGGTGGGWQMQTGNAYSGTAISPSNTGVSDANSTTHLFLLRIDFNASGTTDNMNLWVDPNLANGDPFGTVTPSATLSYDLGSFDVVRLFAGNNNGTAGPAGLNTDELRIGNTFADVVPEPASLGLLIPAGLLLAARRRTRRVIAH